MKKRKQIGPNLLKGILLSTLLLVTFLHMFVSVKSAGASEEVPYPTIYRHDGYSREDVANHVAMSHFSDSKKVILVNRNKFPDAISATNISQGRYPVLYTYNDELEIETRRLIDSMDLDEVYILGGNLSIKDSVIEDLKKWTDAKITRVAGRSRYDANVNAITAHFTQKDHVVIASGEVFSDALYGVSYANTIDAPVVLSNTNRLEASTIELLKNLQAKKATIIGGELTVTPAVEKQLNKLGISYDRISGKNRYIGSAEVANASYTNPETVVLASGEVFSDALVSAPIAQKMNAPILLTRKNDLVPEVEQYLTPKVSSLDYMFIQGGPLAISYTILNSVLDQGEEDLKLSNKKYGVNNIDIGLLNYEFLEIIDLKRAQRGAGYLTYAPLYQKGANIRAEEITRKFDFYRPDGTLLNTAYESLPTRGLMELPAKVHISADEWKEVQKGPNTVEEYLAFILYSTYASNSSDNYYLFSEKYTEMTLSVYYKDNGDIYSVLNLRDTTL